jgi:hypothetical protein
MDGILRVLDVGIPNLWGGNRMDLANNRFIRRLIGICFWLASDEGFVGRQRTLGSPDVFQS